MKSNQIFPLAVLLAALLPATGFPAGTVSAEAPAPAPRVLRNQWRDGFLKENPTAPLLSRFLERARKLDAPPPSGIEDADYLRLIAGNVDYFTKHQDENGAIRDPYRQKETQYATPCYALAAAMLVEHAGRADLRAPALRAMDWAVRSLAGNKAADNHQDFYPFFLAHALPILARHAAPGQAARWKEQLASLEPWTLYRGQPGLSNWNVKALAGEAMLKLAGVRDDASYIDHSLAAQGGHFRSPWGLYRDWNPSKKIEGVMCYDLFPRAFLAVILEAGWRGMCADRAAPLIDRGAITSLFLESPAGELPSGGRSAHHQWNESLEVLTFELYAAKAARAGDAFLAGVYKRAARLAFASMRRWQRPSGELWIVKNRFDPKTQHGFEVYSGYSSYNLMPMALLGIAWQQAQKTAGVREQITPAELGGFIVNLRPEFPQIIANAGGAYIQINTAPDPRYNVLGLNRVHYANFNPQLGPGDSVNRKSDRPRYPAGPRKALAIGLSWKDRDGDKWDALANYHRDHVKKVEVEEQAATPGEVRFKIIYEGDFGGVGRVEENYKITPGAIEISGAVDGYNGPLRYVWPVLADDGARQPAIRLEKQAVSVSLDGDTQVFAAPGGGPVRVGETRYPFHNGWAREASADFAPGQTPRLVVRPERAAPAVAAAGGAIPAALKPAAPPPPPARTFARHVPERKGDFAWENDRVAFRAYGPPLKKGAEDSGIDCWFKRVDYPVIDKWYGDAARGKSYHKDHGEGYDPYHVGSSRGCGGLALWHEGRMVLSNVYNRWEKISDEPDRTVFRLYYSYDLGGRKIDEAKTITIQAGSQLFRVDADFSEAGKPLRGQEIAIGVTTHDGKARATLAPAAGWMSCWETIDGAGVGTGVVIAPSRVIRMFEMSADRRDSGHAIALVKTDDTGRVSYHAGFAWTRAGRIPDAAAWNRHLAEYSTGDTAAAPVEKTAAAAAESGPADIRPLLEKVAAFQLRAYDGKMRANWKSGTFFMGVIALHAATGEARYLDDATAWAGAARWNVSKYHLHADGIAAANNYLALYALDPEPRRIADIKTKLGDYLGRAEILREELVNPRWKDARRPFTGRNLWWWCDALYFAPPILARMSALGGDPRYRELMHVLYWDAVEFLRDKEEGLFFRDESQFPARKKTPSGGKIFWARGNGWVLAGLVRVLEYIPENDPARPRYIKLFQELAARVAACQQPAGHWCPSMTEPAWFPVPETSGTALFCYAFAAGVNRGWLDRATFQPAAEKAWESLVTHVSDDGRLGYAQLVAMAPGPVNEEDFADYAHGAFLLAGCEIHHLRAEKKAPATDRARPRAQKQE
ncbi:MAG: glycoside hydrolase family 88 protein [Opitutaceae bacterium]|jgi:rhamnogalacturonyl hydrolase YesR|nr:glycoside hydrolase family 88 protein [Opitutaceae bacterium]